MIRSALPVSRFFAPGLACLLVACWLTSGVVRAQQPNQGLIEAWNLAAPGVAPWRIHPLESALLLEDAKGSVTAVDLASGSPLWSVSMGRPLDVAPSEHAGVTVLSAGLKCVTLQVASGVRLDERTLPSPAAAAGVFHAGQLFVLSLSGTLHAFMSGGAQSWAYRGVEQLGDSLFLAPFRERPLLLLTNGAGRLLALPAQAKQPHRVVWQLDLGAEPVGGLRLDHTGILHAALSDGQLVAVAAESGRVVWRQPLPGTPGAPALGRRDVVFAGGGWGLVAHSASTGERLWSQTSSAFPRGANSNSVLIRSGERSVRWLNARDGHELELPEHLPQRLSGELLFAWDAARLHAYRVPRAEKLLHGNSEGALN